MSTLPPTVYVSGSIQFEARLDLAELIRKFPREYAGIDLDERDAQEWERPAIFAEEVVAEGLGIVGLSEPTVFLDDPDFNLIRWTEADFRELVTRCPEADLIHDPDHADRITRLPGPLDQPLPFEVVR